MFHLPMDKDLSPGRKIASVAGLNLMLYYFSLLLGWARMTFRRPLSDKDIFALAGHNHGARLLQCAGILLGLVFGCGKSAAAEPATTSKPNIVILLTDDLGWGDCSCYGAKTIQTPNVDWLAANGMRFTDAYAPASTCTDLSLIL